MVCAILLLTPGINNSVLFHVESGIIFVNNWMLS